MIDKVKLPEGHVVNLFPLLIEFVFGEGGDGGGTIVCKWSDYKDIADRFESYVKINHNAKFGKIRRQEPYDDINWERTDYDGYVIFECSPEESFCIRDSQTEVNQFDQVITINI